MSFLTPLGFLGALLAGPIILLYMLRLRREERVVSSTFLWEQVLQDNEANTPWQRLRRNWLLLLQLLILALLVMALARPFVTVPAVATGQSVLLLDASASMTTLEPDGRTRFAHAQSAALDIISTLGENDTLTLIRVGAVPDVLISQSNDRAALRAAIQNIQADVSRADWNAALTLAAGAASGESFRVVIVGDGGLGQTVGLPGIQGEVRYVPVGESAQNVGISALATRARAGNPPELFVQMTNYGDREARVVLDLTVDGERLTAERVTVPANGDKSLVSNALPDGFDVIRASITLAADSDTPDALAADDVAWAVVDRDSTLEALVISDGGRFIDRVLAPLPGVTHVNATPQQGIPNRPFDLYVFEDVLPDALPDGDLLFINPPRDVAGLFTLGELLEGEAALNPRVTTNDPRTAFLDVDTLNLRAFRPLMSAAWAEPLVSVEGGGVIWAGETDGRQIAVFAFPLAESDLPLQIAFPILMNNLIDWYRPQSAAVEQSALRVNESVRVQTAAAADRVRVVKPDGTRRDFTLNSPLFIYADTDSIGVYELTVYDGNRELQSGRFAVNLFDMLESDIAVREAVTVGRLDVVESEGDELGQREFWSWLALAALILLMLEWWAHHRRLAGPRGVFAPLRR